MISGVNNDNSNLMQLLLSATKNTSGANRADGASSLSKDELDSLNSTSKSGESDFLSCLKSNFSAIDSNGDNQLSHAELKSYTDTNKPMGPPPGMVIENMATYRPEEPEIQPADGVSAVGGIKEEDKAGFKGPLKQILEALDINKDGKLSKEDLAAVKDFKGVQNAIKEVDNKVSDAFSSIWGKVNSSQDSGKILEQFTKKISEAYGQQGASGNLLSSVLDLAI